VQLAASMAAWIDTYRDGQDYDFIIVGSNAGINDWNSEQILEAIRPITRRLTVTSHEWMMPVTMLGMTKVPEEQGEWSGQVALQILAGTEPDSIPVIANRKWDLFINSDLIDIGQISLPDQLASKGKEFR
jgi:hypothetical protein